MPKNNIFRKVGKAIKGITGKAKRANIARKFSEMSKRQGMQNRSNIARKFSEMSKKQGMQSRMQSLNPLKKAQKSIGQSMQKKAINMQMQKGLQKKRSSAGVSKGKIK